VFGLARVLAAFPAEAAAVTGGGFVALLCEFLAVADGAVAACALALIAAAIEGDRACAEEFAGAGGWDGVAEIAAGGGSAAQVFLRRFEGLRGM
jgi:hypothetical protein